jgi:adenosylcobinamide kinase / adenosylcobinamide-phosphate guanylyltransferase
MTLFAENQSEALGRLVLVTGPTRSGKSDWAETLAARSQHPVLYLATSLQNPEDIEWQARIEMHRDHRPQDWVTEEVPYDLAVSIRRMRDSHCLLVDALGNWVANCLEQPSPVWHRTEADFLEALSPSPHQIILVAEEVGWGVVPAYPAGRLFRDRLGNLTRQVGAIADRIYLVTAGYAVDLKQLGQAVPQHVKQNHEKIQGQ